MTDRKTGKGVVDMLTLRERAIQLLGDLQPNFEWHTKAGDGKPGEPLCHFFEHSRRCYSCRDRIWRLDAILDAFAAVRLNAFAAGAAEWDETGCPCHRGSVCGTPCKRGLHHEGCPRG